MISSFPQPFLLKPANEIYRDDKEKINRTYPSAGGGQILFLLRQSIDLKGTTPPNIHQHTIDYAFTLA